MQWKAIENQSILFASKICIYSPSNISFALQETIANDHICDQKNFQFQNLNFVLLPSQKSIINLQQPSKTSANCLCFYYHKVMWFI